MKRGNDMGILILGILSVWAAAKFMDLDYEIYY